MKDFLGPFLRYLHHILLASLAEGAQSSHLYPTNRKEQDKGTYFDRSTYIAILKAIKTLIAITPYQYMREGLAGTMVHALIGNLFMLERMNNRD